MPGGPGRIQSKLIVNEPGDVFEQQADSVAKLASSTTGASHDGHGETGGQNRVQRRPVAASRSIAPRQSAATLQPPDSGSPLNTTVRRRVEPLLGADLSSVRVHGSPAARATARALDAQAFTHQDHIWLGPSQSPDDVELLAHEATHVVQQRGGNGAEPQVQRRPEDYEHPEDGTTVQNNLGEQVANRTEDGGSDSDDGDDSVPEITPEERAEKKGELAPYSRPPADRPAQAGPKVAQAASEVRTEADAPSEPLAEGAQQTPQDKGKGGAIAAANTAAAMGVAAFARAAAQPLPDVPPPVLPPLPVLPVNAEGETVQADPAADDAAAALAGEIQRMRNEGLIARQRATGLRANAHRMRGNLRIAHGSTEAAEQGIIRAQGHVETRREIASQARVALAVSKEKAATVAAQAPEYAERATKTHEDSGPMATGAKENAGASRSNVPDDPEAAENMQESAGQMEQVSNDAASVDTAVTGTQARGEALVAEAAQAREKNTATSASLAATDQAIEQTDSRLSELGEQNKTARAQIAGVEQGPAQLDAGAASVDARALAILAASDELETQIQAAQDDFSADMQTVPGSKAIAVAAESEAASSPPATVQRDANTAYGDRIQVDAVGWARGVLGWARGPATAAARHEQEERAARAAERRRTRLREINDRANSNFSSLGAIDKMGLALDITAENLMDDLGGARWPNILGQMALAFVDPTVSLEGVVSGLNMTVSGAANLFSAQQWERDPLGNLLKSAADIATGLTIILGSIAGLCTAILVILGALAIITLGAMGPAFAAASVFLGPIITTVGGWAIGCAAIAAELQFYVLIKNLVDAATASTAGELEHESDQMTEDATQAANMAAQVAVASVMEAGGSALAETAVGQRLGTAARSVGETSDMVPPSRGAPVLEPGAVPPPEPLAPPAEVPAPPAGTPALEAPGPSAPPIEAQPPVPSVAPEAPSPAPATPAQAPVAPTEAPRAAAPAEAPAPAASTPAQTPTAPAETPRARAPEPAEPQVPPEPPVPSQRPTGPEPPPRRMGTVTASPEGIVEHPPSNPVVERIPPRRGGAGTRPEPAARAEPDLINGQLPHTPAEPEVPPPQPTPPPAGPNPPPAAPETVAAPEPRPTVEPPTTSEPATAPETKTPNNISSEAPASEASAPKAEVLPEGGAAAKEPKPTEADETGALADDALATDAQEPVDPSGQRQSPKERVREKTRRKLEDLQRQQLGNQAELERVQQEISAAQETVSRLRQKVLDSPRGSDARAEALREFNDAKTALEDAEGSGLLDERQGLLEERRKLRSAEEALLSSLKLERPPLRASTKQAIKDAAKKTPDGKYLDANTGEVIDGELVYGHKYGREHRRLVLEATEKGMTQEQFNKWVNNHPEWFQTETKANNVSHRFEKPGLE